MSGRGRFSPTLWGPRRESDARTQHDELFQVVDAVGRYSREGQSSLDDDLHGDRLRPHKAAHAVERAGVLGHRGESRTAAQAAAEQADSHVSRVLAAADVPQRAEDVAGFENPAGGD